MMPFPDHSLFLYAHPTAIVYIPNRLMLKEHNAAFNTYQVQVNKENITFGIDNGYQQLSDEGVNLCIGCLVMYRR